MRFGRRVPLPSTASIKHDLRMMMSSDRISALQKELSELPAEAGSDETKNKPALAANFSGQ